MPEPSRGKRAADHVMFPWQSLELSSFNLPSIKNSAIRPKSRAGSSKKQETDERFSIESR